MRKNSPEHSTRRPSLSLSERLRASPGLQFVALFAAIVLTIGAITLLIVLLSLQSTSLPTADASATAEANAFATAQVYRQATKEAQYAVATAQAATTAEAQAESSATAVAYANSTATRSARATIEAPPTLTAEAKEYLEEQASAAATIQAIDPQARLVFGPSSGSLAHHPGGGATCDDTGVTLRNFVAEARFYNPYAVDQGWDYGIVFTNPSDEDQSRYEITVSSVQWLSLRLEAPGYYLDSRGPTNNPLDLTGTGSNFLKVYVLGDTAHVYVNGRFESTFDLRQVNFGNPMPGAHGIKICTGVRENDAQAGKSTRYEAFSIWSVP